MQKILKNKGFTIIEVLIVLAIIAVMMLAVFLAVPALNRNSRNNAIESDAQIILGAVGDFRGANNGANPGANGITNTNGLLVVTNSSIAGVNPVENRVKGNTVVAPSNTMPGVNEIGRVNYAIGFKCASPTAIGGTNPRSVAVMYRTETGATSTAQHCVDS